MKPKITLCLAFVLSGGLFGCSTMSSGVLNDSSEGKLFSNQEAICLKSDDSSRPWMLKYALSEETFNDNGLFVTIHQRISSHVHLEWEPESTAAIYVQMGDKFKLLKRLYQAEDSGPSCFLKPDFIWAIPKGEDRERLVQITELFYGSGALTQEHIFEEVVMPTVVTPGGDLKSTPVRLEEVELIPAWESYQFGKDEIIGRGMSSTLTDDGLIFDFNVSRYDGKNFYPVGKVTGTYKLERKSDGGLKISMDTFKRELVKDEDWH